MKWVRNIAQGPSFCEVRVLHRAPCKQFFFLLAKPWQSRVLCLQTATQGRGQQYLLPPAPLLSSLLRMQAWSKAGRADGITRLFTEGQRGEK